MIVLNTHELHYKYSIIYIRGEDGMRTIDNDKLDRIIEEITTKKYIYGAVFNVSKGDESESWCGASGNLTVDSRYYIASINKLISSSMVLKLITEGRLSLNDSLSKYLPESSMKGLHVYQGKDYSNDITILHMLSQTSGLPCYLEDKPAKGISIIKELEAGID